MLFLQLCMYVCAYESLSLSLSLSMCVCLSVISITQKQIEVEISNLVFQICIIKQMLLETLYKDRTKPLCTGEHKRILMHYGLWTEFIVSEFTYF